MTQYAGQNDVLDQPASTGDGMPPQARATQVANVGAFAEVVLPHLDAAYNLAYWLVRNDADAEDVVQDAYVRALRYFDGFRGGDARRWLLTIVRNASYRWLQKNRMSVTPFDEDIHGGPSEGPNPETILLQNADSELIERAMSRLPVRLREILVLRELEGLSYREIADVMDVAIGTVMSGLSRARERFRQTVIDIMKHHSVRESTTPVAAGSEATTG